MSQVQVAAARALLACQGLWSGRLSPLSSRQVARFLLFDLQLGTLSLVVTWELPAPLFRLLFGFLGQFAFSAESSQ